MGATLRNCRTKKSEDTSSLRRKKKKSGRGTEELLKWLRYGRKFEALIEGVRREDSGHAVGN